MTSSRFIAELGINHHGNFEKAKRMVAKAVEIGASAIKTQYYDAEKLLGKDSPYYEYAKSCQLTKMQHEQLSRLSKQLGVDFAVTVFDHIDLPWASGISDFIKIASRKNTDNEFIDVCLKQQKPVIMSIQTYAQQNPIYNIQYMWCVMKYPSEGKECLNYVFDEKHGLSSHCPDWKVTVDAYTRGARLFENHVCENKDEQGCDIPASLTFEELKRAINAIKNISTGLAVI